MFFLHISGFFGRLWASQFVFGVYVPVENFSLIWRRHRFRFLTYARHSWPFTSESSLSCHTYCPFFNGHLRGYVIITSVAERFAVELSIPVFTT